MKKLLAFLILLIVLSLPFSSVNAISLTDNVACLGDGNCTPCDLLTVAFNFAKFIFVSMAALVLLFILWQSLFLVLNMGNEETVKTAKDKIKNTLIAALIILGAYSIVALAINIYSDNLPGSKNTGWWAKGWWTGPVCPSGKRPETIQSTGAVTEGCGHDIGVPCNCSDYFDGCHCGGIPTSAGINAWQCEDASIELEQLLVCFKREVGKEGLTLFNITSISDDDGLNNCRTAYVACPTGSNGVGCCDHMKGSCHYGGSGGINGSFAADFGVGPPTQVNFRAITGKYKSIVKRCGGNYIDETEIAGVPRHFHISAEACSGE